MSAVGQAGSAVHKACRTLCDGTAAEVVVDTADYANSSLTDHHVATHADVVDVQAEWVEEHDDQLNAIGTNGIGEIGIVGSPAAVLNAVWHATGVRVRELPITPDRLLGGLPERQDVL